MSSKEEFIQLQGKGAFSVLDLTVRAVRDNKTGSLELLVLRVGVWRESPVTRNKDLLGSRELVLATTETLDGVLNRGGLSSNGQEDLVDLNTGDQTLRLTEGVTHTSLESIGSSTGQHLVDTEYVVRVDTDTQVEGVSASHLLQVLVDGNTGSFQSFAGNLFLLERNQVDADWNISI